MVKAYILKTAKYNPIKDNLSKYESLDLVTRDQYSPPIVADSSEILLAVDQPAVTDVDYIFHSPALRTFQTAQILKESLSPNAVLVEMPFLAEVFFSLKDLVSKEEYEKMGSNLVRKRFLEVFDGQLVCSQMESAASIQKRILGFLSLLKGEKYQNKKLVAVSHSFFMKVLQIFLMESTLFENPALLLKHFDWQKRTFEFCQGFYISI